MLRPMFFVLPALLLATPALAGDGAGDGTGDSPDSEGVQLEWRSPNRLAVTARVALPNGCHQPQDIRDITPQGTTPVSRAVAITVSLKVEEGMCTQEYRIHRFDLTVDVPADANGVILYETRTGRPMTATLHALPKRPKTGA